jgi:hypothetical protein
MSAIKRAKWIEGITQSKRVLRDLAEIVTSALRDESGIVAEENWTLVYPRPFAEEFIERGRLIQDETNLRRYTPVADRQELVLLTGTTPVALKGTEIISSTLIVKSEDLATEYVLDTDYTYDEANQTIARIDAGGIIDGEKVQVFYGVTFHKILNTMPVTVEKILTVADPDREIIPSVTPYTIDYTNKKIVFAGDPPMDAEYFALTFTEITGAFSRQEQTMLRLEKDGLDPDGRTYRLPAGIGEIAEDMDKREVAGTITGGDLGTNGSGSIQYLLDPINHTVEFTTGAPTLTEKQTLYVNVAEYTDGTETTTRSISAKLAPDSSDPSGQTFKMIGTFNKLNKNVKHSVDIETDATKPVLFKHLSDLHAGYEIIEGDELIINYDSPLITTRKDVTEDLVVTLTSRGEDDLSVGLSKITDRVVLKTKTQPEQEFSAVIGEDFGAKDTATELEMFVEMIKPDRLINPETGLERFTDFKGRQQQTQKNNHYIMSRMFDRWDDQHQKPEDAKYDTSGAVLDKGAYVSDWSKYAWFKDWKEYMVDELDDDPGISNAGDGVVFQEVETQGMTEEFPVQFWVSTNNNRLAIVLMGDPTLDQDNFLTSFAYFGRIHPFFDSQCVVKYDDQGVMVVDADGKPVLEEKRTYFENDVAGNFALTTGSSTMPAAIGTPPKGVALLESVELNVDRTTDPATIIAGDLYDRTAFAYMVTYLTEIGESKPTPLDAGRIVVPAGTVSAGATDAQQGVSLSLRFRLPDEATGYRIYRYHSANTTAFGSDANKHENFKLVTSVEKLDRQRTIEYVDEGNILPMYDSKYDPIADATTIALIADTVNPFYKAFLGAVATARSFESVMRDRFTGAILDVKFSDKFGKDTATGVNDVMMYQTRSGLKYQRHQAAFITTEEFMRKEKSGQSRWTGKFHLSPIYIEHSYDKQRGWLDGVMAVDDSGIEHLDELIVDKDTPNEEVYKFFRVNAPFSLFNNSPNYAYGIAIVKSSLKWE